MRRVREMSKDLEYAMRFGVFTVKCGVPLDPGCSHDDGVHSARIPTHQHASEVNGEEFLARMGNDGAPAIGVAKFHPLWFSGFSSPWLRGDGGGMLPGEREC